MLLWKVTFNKSWYLTLSLNALSKSYVNIVLVIYLRSTRVNNCSFLQRSRYISILSSAVSHVFNILYLVNLPLTRSIPIQPLLNGNLSIWRPDFWDTFQVWANICTENHFQSSRNFRHVLITEIITDNPLDNFPWTWSWNISRKSNSIRRSSISCHFNDFALCSIMIVVFWHLLELQNHLLTPTYKCFSVLVILLIYSYDVVNGWRLSGFCGTSKPLVSSWCDFFFCLY